MDIYVDGSYNKTTGYYGWAYIGIIPTENNFDIVLQGSGTDNIANSIWNVAGELCAVTSAIISAYNSGINDLDIYYDYKGIEEWAMGRWKAKNEFTKKYVDFINKCKDLGITLRFHKVKGHSGDEYNDMVDKLAKKACGVK